MVAGYGLEWETCFETEDFRLQERERFAVDFDETFTSLVAES